MKRPETIMVLLFTFFLAVITWRPIVDADMFFGIATGQAILATHAIPRNELFSWSALGRPYIAYEWASQTILAFIYALGGVTAVSLYVTLVFSFSFLLIYYFFRHLSGRSYLTSLFCAVFTATFIYEFFVPRPQIIGLTLFLLVFLALARVSQKPHSAKGLWWLIPLAYLWANLHPSFVFLIYLSLAYTVIMLRHHPKLGALLWAITLAEMVATLLPPQGLGSYEILATIFKNRAFIYQFYDEWQPLFTNSIRAYLYLVLVGSTAILLIIRLLWPRGKVSQFLWLSALVPFVFLPLASIRHLPWGILAACFIGATLLPRFHLDKLGKFVSMLLIVILLFVLIYQRSNLAQANWNLPVTAINFLKDHKLQGRMFNDMSVGGYLSAELYPDYHIFFDGRAEVFLCCEMPDFQKLVTAKSAGRSAFTAALQDFIHKYNFSYLVIPTSSYNPVEFSTTSLAADVLTDDPNWVLVYVSDFMRIILRRDGQNDQLINDFGMNAVTAYRRIGYRPYHEKEAIQEYQRMIAVGDSGVSRTGLGQAYLALGDTDHARENFVKATVLNPRLGRPYVGLAQIDLQKGQITQAIVQLKTALTIAPYLGQAYLLLGEAYWRQGQQALAIKTLETALGQPIDFLVLQQIIQTISKYKHEYQ